MKDGIQELERDSNIKNIRNLYRGIDYFKKGYQPSTEIVKDEKGELGTVADGILARCRNQFCQLLKVMLADRNT